jgi:uncharacterized membrane protein YgdD (TMEM256/DUF423 family)
VYWSGLGALLLGVAVMFGAFGAHALRGRLDGYSLGVYERAVFYHFVHALGMLVVPLMARAGWLTATIASVVCALLLVGIVVFCGSLYALAMTGVRALGAITPIGGVAFIAAWLLLALVVIRASLAGG